MGKRRILPKIQEPGFRRIGFDEQPTISQLTIYKEAPRSSYSNKTKRGTSIHIQPEMSRKQLARIIKMLEGRQTHGLG